jgi:hypothetical protein
MKMEQSVPKRRHVKFSRRGLTQKKEYKNAVMLLKVPSPLLTDPISLLTDSCVRLSNTVLLFVNRSLLLMS